jgi:pyruvate,water dikinase
MRPQIGPEAGRGRPLIVALDHVDTDALPLVGGKAANLGELIAAGLPVPAGFCVTTEAYREVAAAAALAEILDRLATTPAGDTGALAGLARQARERILGMVMPVPVADAVAAAATEEAPTAYQAPARPPGPGLSARSPSNYRAENPNDLAARWRTAWRCWPRTTTPRTWTRLRPPCPSPACGS